MNQFLLVASDVHSDEESFSKLAKIASQKNCIGFLYAGDLDVENPIISLELSNRNFVFLPVIGNCDSPWQYQRENVPAPPVFRNCTYNGLKIGISHGHLYTEQEDCDIVITGHTHIPKLEKIGNTVFLNPGSAALPRGCSEKGYATIEFEEDKCLVSLRVLSDQTAYSSMVVLSKK